MEPNATATLLASLNPYWANDPFKLPAVDSTVPWLRKMAKCTRELVAGIIHTMGDVILHLTLSPANLLM